LRLRKKNAGSGVAKRGVRTGTRRAWMSAIITQREREKHFG